jgi:hypothetical protein
MKRPFVGLGVEHGPPNKPNLKSRRWAIRQLRQLRRRGYKRVVIEPDMVMESENPYFGRIAEEAKAMGFDIEFASKRPHRVIGRLHEKTVEGIDRLHETMAESGSSVEDPSLDDAIIMHDRAAVAASRDMARRTFKKPDSVMVGGGFHIVHVDEKFAKEHEVPFEARYSYGGNPDEYGIAGSELRVYENHKKRRRN